MNTTLSVLISVTDSVAIRTSPSYSGMTSCRLSLCLLAVAGLPGTVLTVSTTQQNIMDDIVGVWGQYRDPLNGFWCDTLRFTSGTPVDILCNSRVSTEKC